MDALKEDVRHYREELQAVSSLARRLQAEMDHLGQAGLTAENESLQGESEADEESRPESAAEHKGHIASMEENFLAEDYDVSWRPQRELKQRLAQILPRGSALDEIECRTSICRLVTSHIDMSGYRNFTDAFSLLGSSASGELSPPVWDGWVGFEVPQEPTHEGDMVVAKMFLGRPDPPQFE